MRIKENKNGKVCMSTDYNFIFNKRTGFFARWGKTKEEDPQFSPFGPEILDLEISSGGDCKGRCSFCYKSNGGDEPTHNMTFKEFQIIFHKMPKTLTQIAFGIMNITTNSDFFKMMKYAKRHGVIPNYTCHGLDMTEEFAEKTAQLCGAVAVSLLNKNKTYDTIKMLTDKNMDQINIHYMLSEQTYETAFEIIDDIASDPRLKKFNAIVFLQYKCKGSGVDNFTSVLNVEKYQQLTDYCDKKGVRYGFDSCSAHIYTESIQDKEDEEKKQLEMMVEPCESGLFSSYINCRGKFFVCSFAEGEDNWKTGIDVLSCNNFLKEVWFHPRLMEWRQRLIKNDRHCPIYNLEVTNNDRIVV